MNFWRRNIGDYAKKTGHLTMQEHGAYTLLLDRIYATEAPIHEGDVYRVARAMTRPERNAVDAVLREFFVLADDGWTNERASEEIEIANHRADANRQNGKAGGRPRKAGGKAGPTCPQQDIIAAYHEILPELPPVNDWPDSAATSLRNLWRKSAERQSLEWWRGFFQHVRGSGFLMGDKGDFQASLIWLVKPANFAKVLNGNYDDRRKA